MSVVIKVRLSADDIERGDPAEPDSCPVARALTRSVSGAVGGSWQATKDYLVWNRPGGSATRWPTPLKVCSWIKRFDRYHGVDRDGWPRRILGTRFPPISFDLETDDNPGTAAKFQEEVALSVSKRRGEPS